MNITNFNIRVYGLYLNKLNHLLISNETYNDRFLTKFIGGGLEKGESTKACLIREFKEELDEGIEVQKLFYVTDFFQQSAFKPEDQIISIYYWITPLNELSFNQKIITGFKNQKLEWLDLSNITSDKFTFRADQYVSSLIKKS